MSDNSVTQFIHLLQKWDRNAAVPIWNHFYTRLVSLANKKLKSRVRLAAAAIGMAILFKWANVSGAANGAKWALLIACLRRRSSFALI